MFQFRRFQLLCSSLAQKPVASLFPDEKKLQAVQTYIDELEIESDNKEWMNCYVLSFLIAQYAAIRLKKDALSSIKRHVPNKLALIAFCDLHLARYMTRIASFEVDIPVIDEDGVPPLMGAAIKSEADLKFDPGMIAFTKAVYNATDPMPMFKTHDTVLWAMKTELKYPELRDYLTEFQVPSNAFGPRTEIKVLAIGWGLDHILEEEWTSPPVIAYMKYLLLKQSTFNASSRMSKKNIQQHIKDELYHIRRLRQFLYK